MVTSSPRMIPTVPKPIHEPSTALASQDADSRSPKSGMNQQQQQQHRLQFIHHNRILQQQRTLHHVPRFPQHPQPIHQQHNLLHQLPKLPQHQLIAPLGAVPQMPPSLSAEQNHFKQVQLRMMGNPAPAPQTLLASVNYNKPSASANKTQATSEFEKAELDVLERRQRLAEAQERAKKEAEALAEAEAAIAKARELPQTTTVLLKQSASAPPDTLKRPPPSTSNGPPKKRERPFASILKDLDKAFLSSSQSEEKKTSDDSLTIKNGDKVSQVGAGALNSAQLDVENGLHLHSKEMMDMFAKTAAAAIANKSIQDDISSGGDASKSETFSSSSRISPPLDPSPTVAQSKNLETSATSKVGSSMALPTSSHVVTNVELEAARKMMKIPGKIVQMSTGSVPGHWELVHPQEFRQNKELAKILPKVVSKSSSLSHDSYHALSKTLTPPNSLQMGHQ